MIAKRIELRNQQMSSFSRLLKYITNTQDKNERVGTIRVTNCSSDDPEWAAMEAEAVQARNKRSQIDKTYHLLVSFREGDSPTLEVLEAIENRICMELGYGEHQRVSAIHYDTDHTHIHIAINKIHPKRFTAHEPYFDKRKLGELCQTFEQEYGIAPDNHIPRMTQGEAKAQDMEKSSGIESLIGWIKRGILAELLIVDSWNELHALLGTNGLTLAVRGNGLVIIDSSGIAAKASSVSRLLSKAALEKRLGAFSPGPLLEAKVAQRYEFKPVASKVNTQQLWALYERERLQLKQRYAVLGERAKDRKERRISAAKKVASAKRAAIKLTKGKMAKTILYHSVSQSFLKEMETIRQDYKEDRQKIFEKGKRIAWYDWLKVKAGEGNTEALEVLRRRYEKQAAYGNTIAGQRYSNANSGNSGPQLAIDTITKRGTIHYQLAKAVVRDDGDKLRLAAGVGEDIIQSTLTMAMKRFGPQLAVHGTEQFRQQVIEIAANTRLNISFADAAMEDVRKALMAQNSDNTGNDAEDAANRYIAERTQTHEKGVDILKHRLYDASDAGIFAYAGVRNVEGKTLMLLQTPLEMLVLPIDQKTVQRTQRLQVGSKIEVNAKGIVHSRSRSH